METGECSILHIISTRSCVQISTAGAFRLPPAEGSGVPATVIAGTGKPRINALGPALPIALQGSLAHTNLSVQQLPVQFLSVSDSFDDRRTDQKSALQGAVK